MILVLLSDVAQGQTRSPVFERHRENQAILDAPSRGRNLFEDYPRLPMDRAEAERLQQQQITSKGVESESELFKAAGAGRSTDGVTERILQELELRRAAKRRRALAERLKWLDPWLEGLLADGTKSGDTLKPRANNNSITEELEEPGAGDDRPNDARRRSRTGLWQGRRPASVESTQRWVVTGRSAFDPSLRPQTGGLRAGAPAARDKVDGVDEEDADPAAVETSTKWALTGLSSVDPERRPLAGGLRAGAPAARDPIAEEVQSKPLNAGRPIKSPFDVAAESSSKSEEGGPTAAPRGGRVEVRRPPLFPDRQQP
jgi:hypothetical protein